MKYLKQLLYILAFCLAGQALQALIPLPIPAAIYGLLLMLTALCTGLLKPDAIADSARYLITIMPVLFVAPGVQLLQYWDIISADLAAIVLVLVISTWIVFAVAGVVTQRLIKEGGEENG